ncbi:hypothetical protein GQ54DRAFT_306962 [Martensiomyces pterosporus]|nr:hypothetical protein GQ54DRAFT_306962 [Martensiomyces pterosporus]
MATSREVSSSPKDTSFSDGSGQSQKAAGEKAKHQRVNVAPVPSYSAQAKNYCEDASSGLYSNYCLCSCAFEHACPTQRIYPPRPLQRDLSRKQGSYLATPAATHRHTPIANIHAFYSYSLDIVSFWLLLLLLLLRSGSSTPFTHYLGVGASLFMLPLLRSVAAINAAAAAAAAACCATSGCCFQG